MNPKRSIPFELLKLPGMNAIQEALRPRSAGAGLTNCKSSNDRMSLAERQARVVNQQHNTAISGAKGAKPAPAGNSFLRHSPLNFRNT